MGTPKLNEAWLNTLASIAYYENLITDLQGILGAVGNLAHGSKVESIDGLFSFLNNAVANGFKRLFQLAHVTRKEAHITAAQQLVAKQMLRERFDLSSFLSFGMITPRKHKYSDVEALKEEVRAALSDAGESPPKAAADLLKLLDDAHARILVLEAELQVVKDRKEAEQPENIRHEECKRVLKSIDTHLKGYIFESFDKLSASDLFEKLIADFRFHVAHRLRYPYEERRWGRI